MSSGGTSASFGRVAAIDLNRHGASVKRRYLIGMSELFGYAGVDESAGRIVQELRIMNDILIAANRRVLSEDIVATDR